MRQKQQENSASKQAKRKQSAFILNFIVDCRTWNKRERERKHATIDISAHPITTMHCRKEEAEEQNAKQSRTKEAQQAQQRERYLHAYQPSQSRNRSPNDSAPSPMTSPHCISCPTCYRDQFQYHTDPTQHALTNRRPNDKTHPTNANTDRQHTNTNTNRRSDAADEATDYDRSTDRSTDR